jgi:hypothetical protein
MKLHEIVKGKTTFMEAYIVSEVLAVERVVALEQELVHRVQG